MQLCQPGGLRHGHLAISASVKGGEWLQSLECLSPVAQCSFRMDTVAPWSAISAEKGEEPRPWKR